MKVVVVEDKREPPKVLENVRSMVHSDRRLIIKTVAVQLHLDKETVKRAELWPNDWILHHDNALDQKALSVKQFLAQESITEMEHPPHSHDLGSNDFWLFSK
jgi:hypothetical protein